MIISSTGRIYRTSIKLNYYETILKPLVGIIAVFGTALPPSVRGLLIVCALGIWQSLGSAHGIPNDPRFTHISIEHGLSQSTVFAIAQDRTGYLWFGTEDGLNKFDGYGFTVFRHRENDSNSLTDNWVRAIFFDRDHQAWLGTNYGLHVLDPLTEMITRHLGRDSTIDIGASGGVSAIVQDDAGLIWVGTFNGGLIRLDASTGDVTQFRVGQDETSSICDDRVRALVFDPAGFIWVGTKSGLDRIDLSSRSITHFDAGTGSGLSHREVRTLHIDWRGTLWAGTTRGVNRWDSASGKFVAYTKGGEIGTGLRDDWVNIIRGDREGYLWVGTRNGGLHHLDVDAEAFRSFFHQPEIRHSIASNNIMSVFEDRSGVCWVGTYLAGISKFNRHGDKFTLYQWSPRPMPSVVHNTVRAIFEDRRGNIWVGTLDGLTKLNPDKEPVKHYQHDPTVPEGLNEYQVLSIGEDRKGRIWLGTYGSGIDILDPTSSEFRHLTADDGDPTGLSNNFVQVIERDKRDRMWVGTRKGLGRFDERTNSFTSFRFEHASDPSRFDDSILTVFLESEDRIWMGTYGGGLIQFNPQNETHQRHLKDPSDPRTLSHNHVTSLLRDQLGRFWVGTWLGLNLMDVTTGEFTRFNRTHEGELGVVHAILEGQPGVLWLSSNQGLIRFELDADGNPITEIFDQADGVQGREFNTGSACKSPSGELFFGGIKGMNSFFPKEIQKSEFIPPIVLTSFRVFDREMPVYNSQGGGDGITLSYWENFFSFEFAALDYTFPQKNTYQYKLEGFDKNWVKAGTRRYASYTNLDGGSYVFRVKGANHDGVWNEQGLSLPIRIIPPIWERPWFIALSLLAIVCIVAWRMWDLRRQNILLDQRVQARTAELQNINQALIETQNQLVQTARQAGMAEIASQVLHNIGNAFNGIMISADLIRDQLANSQAGTLLRRYVARLKSQSIDGPPAANGNHNISQSLVKLSDYLDRERNGLERESDQIQSRVNLIKQIIAAQQEFALQGPMWEIINITGLVEDVVKLQAQDISKAGISLKKELTTDAMVKVQKITFLQVMMNVIKNAIEAFQDPLPDRPLIVVRTVARPAGHVCVDIQDNGVGLNDEERERVFSQGYTSKEKGHGLGLHFCANAMSEMGGTITVSSDGPHQGTTFSLILPIHSG